MTTVIVGFMAILASGINNRIDNLLDDLNATVSAESPPAERAIE